MSKKNDRKKEALTFKEGFSNFLTKNHLESKFDDSKVVTLWSEIMGNTINRNTQTIFVRNGIVNVKIESPVLKQELVHSKQKMIDLLNKELGKQIVIDIRFL